MSPIVSPNNPIGQEFASFGVADRRFATVTEGASGRGRGGFGGEIDVE
jgi:hypothetical protein